MEKEKQIEELAKLIDELNRDVIIGYKPMKNGMIADIVKGRTAEEKAEALMDAGYGNVKETVKETAREIFEYIVKSGVINVAPDTIKMFFKERYGVTAFDEEDEK